VTTSQVPADAPAYQIEESEVELRLWPITGKEVGIAVLQDGEEVHTDVVERGFWNGHNRRLQIASQIAGVVDSEDEDAMKNHARYALLDIADDEGEERFEEPMRTSREEDIRERTAEVVVWTGEEPGEDDPEWVVTLRAPSESDAQSPLEFSLSSRQFFYDDSAHFDREHAEAFGTETGIDGEEWDSLTSYWNDIQELREGEKAEK
jgi:hypothetical protein